MFQDYEEEKEHERRTGVISKKEDKYIYACKFALTWLHYNCTEYNSWLQQRVPLSSPHYKYSMYLKNTFIAKYILTRKPPTTRGLVLKYFL